MSNITLNALGLEHQTLLSKLYDQETGEIDEKVEAQLTALHETEEKKCISVAKWIKKIESDQNELEHLEAEILKRKEAYNREVKKWQDYLKINMIRCGINEITCPYFTLKIKKNPYSTEIIDEFQIPKEFLKTKEIVRVETKPDKNAIKDYVLKTGMEVPGAKVLQKTELKIFIDKI